jgi:hypothetical protein
MQADYYDWCACKIEIKKNIQTVHIIYVHCTLNLS